VAMSIYSGIYNLGIGSGSYLGGLICTHLSLAYIGYGGGVIVLLSFVYCSLRLVRNMRLQEREQQA
jgi:MFS transporter, DHA1 family, L-arabinose/isopropyl-beta-D-thiogalactopyranoside export protein